MKMELFQKYFNAGHWRTLQAICACSQICNWSTWLPRNSTQLLNINTTKFQVEREPVYIISIVSNLCNLQFCCKYVCAHGFD